MSGSTMSGPGLSIIIQGDASRALHQAAQLLKRHREIGMLKKLDADAFEFGMTSSRGLFILSIDKDFPAVEEAMARELFGHLPESSLQISVMTKGCEIELANAVIYLAQEMAAFIMLETYGSLPDRTTQKGKFHQLPCSEPRSTNLNVIDHHVLKAWTHERRFYLVS